MKKYYILSLSSAFILLLLLTNISCKKYLDIKQNSTQSLIKTANDCQLILNDYGNMNVGYPSDGEASSDNYYLSDAGYLSSTTSTEDRSIYTWQTGAIRNAALPQWQFPYKVIYLSNLVLETLEKIKSSVDQNTFNDLKGQALFFRAYSLWQVAQLYTKPYNKASSGQDAGIPLRFTSDINEVSVRGTVEQTYKQITNDLIDATNLLPVNLVIASRPNKTAAYAMLARVYLSMSDYESALNSANSALSINRNLLDYNKIDTLSSTPFARFNNEVIFQSIMTNGALLVPGAETSNIAKIDLVLFKSYTVNDLRKSIFFKQNSANDIGTYRFTGNYEPSTSSLFDGLAVDELYLIRSECLARIGDISGAMTDLNTLLSTRWKSGTYINITASTPDEALGKVLVERRKELLMRGQRWTDLRRLNNDNRFATTLNRVANGVTYTLPPNDLRYTLLIPNEVIVNSGIIQNSR